MNTASPRLWIVATAVLCAAVVAAGWFLLISPQRAEAAQLDEQRAQLEQSNALLQVQIDELIVQNEKLPELKDELAKVRTAMPADVRLAALTRDLQRIASETGVVLKSVAPGTPAQVMAIIETPAPAAPAGTEGATTTEAAPAAPVAVPGLNQVGVNIEIQGSFENARRFLEGVQTSLGRDYLVDGAVVTALEPADAVGAMPAAVNGDVTLALSGRVFVLTNATDAAAAPAATDGASAAPAATTDN
ncbi:hypothetical protein GCM10028777_24190 [Angustibacter speluncae]